MQFLSARLQAHELAPPIVEELAFVHERLVEAQAEFERARTQRLTATAEITYRDDLVDAAVLNLSREALHLADGDRQNETYLHLFPVEPQTAIASTGGNRQHDFVRQLLERLEAAQYAVLKPHADLLRRRQRELEGALEAREACFAPESAAIAHRTEALDEACRCFNRSYSRLQLLRVDNVLLESLFPVLSRPDGGAADGGST